MFNTVKIEKVFDAPLDRWMPFASYRNEGFVLGFLSMAQDLAIPEPDGYSDDVAKEIQHDLMAQYNAKLGPTQERKAAEEQFNSLKPSIAAVMNESFADLSMHQAIEDAGYVGP